MRYIGCSNFAAWQVVKALAVAEKYGLHRYVVYQGYYSLLGRDYEWELSPMAQDQGLGLMIWSPLGWGRLTGKIKRGEASASGRIREGGASGGPDVDEELMYNVLDVLHQIAEDTGKSVAQVAINWLMQKDSVCNVIIGARDEKQLIENIGSVGWNLSPEYVLQLDEISVQKPLYPHWVGMR
ncbi:MAG TPA: aldo/keto reductase [Chryseosolibacter sp.]|nr:aldo/keto reductase [Chryseosolibacter sp.]